MAGVNSDRTAVVTGASSGIGAATARTLAAAGFHVFCAARRADRIEALAAEIGGTPVACDVTSADSVAALADAVGPASTYSSTTPAAPSAPARSPRPTATTGARCTRST